MCSHMKITKKQARQFMLAHQKIMPAQKLQGKEGILEYIRHVGCIQFDPLNVVGYNPYLVLQSRIKNFKSEYLQELLYSDRKLLDRWDKNMSIYALEDWPYFSRYREKAYRRHGGESNSISKILPEVRDALEQNGPLSSIDLKFDTIVDWSWAPTRAARAALESMYFWGELIIHHKVGTRKVYDFAEKYLPFELLSMPDPNITIGQYFEGSSISTIGLNLIIVSLLLFFLLRNKGFEKEKRNYWVLGTSGFVIMLFSFTRIYLFGIVDKSIQAKNYLLATILSFTIANPYPLFPYLAYGLFASIIGLMIYKKRKNLIKKIFIPIGLFFLIYGLAGCMNFPKTISKADYFWYFKTHLELGIFILVIIFFLLTFEFRIKKIINMPFIKWFSRISLTIYLFETLLSEIFGKILNYLKPAWNQTINGCLIFGASNIVIWILILWIWQKNNFKFSLEYWWVKIFHKLGKKSTKMDFPTKL